MSTKDEILSLLRREALTISEMAARLGVSRNAVIVPLKQLEASSLIEGVKRKASGAGKPALEYSAVAGREDIGSSAYPAYAELMLRILPEHMTRAQIGRFMDEVGRELAASLDTSGLSRFSDRLKAATDFVDSVGAETGIERTRTSTIVRSYSCPVARAVRQEPCVCSSVASFFATATGAEVHERCDRGKRLRCKFEIMEKSPVI